MIFLPSKAAANEILSSEPSFGADMLNQFYNYFNDHFAFRQEFITLWAYLNSGLFKTSVEEKVLLGTDGWLYYSQDLGNALSDEQLNTIARNIRKIQDDVEKKGRKFIFTIAPDKTNLHADNLPANIHNESMGKKIKPFLIENGVNYVDLFDESIPYFSTDSHWTTYGAAMVCDKLIGTSFSSRSFDIETSHRGDLYEMLYPAGSFEEDDMKCLVEYSSLSDTAEGNAITIKTEGKGDKVLYCWRDSFGVSLFPFLAEATKSATFSRSTTYDTSKCEDADIVILEIVERNLGKLI